MDPATPSTRRERALLGTASLRLVLALVALVLLPVVYPKLAAHRWLFALYAGVAVLMLAFVWRRVGGVWRSVFDGALDLAVLTFIVHRVGSVMTMLVALYVVAAVLNALVASRRLSMLFAAVAAGLYAAVELAEAVGALPYGPDAPDWAGSTYPGAAPAAIAALLVTLLTLIGAGVVGLLVSELRARERDLAAANRKLEELSQQDPLTLMWNRRHLVARLDEELSQVRTGRSLAVVMLDLDGFKRVNDTHGHLRGDAVLQEIATALSQSTRTEDVAGRYGGDEFVVILPGTAAEQARVAAQRLVDGVRAVGEAAGVTASAGVSVAKPEEGSRSFLRRADEAAYRAKQAGGNRVLVAE